MMKNFIMFTLILSIAGASCTKNNVETITVDNPPPDNNPSQVKKWIVTTVAGQGAPSFVNGPALLATFHFPEDVAVAPNSNTFYVTDVVNSVIRKLANGGVSTFSGSGDFGITDGNGTTAKFKSPYSMTLDADGNIYATDDSDPRIRKISPSGNVSTYAGIETSGFADGNANLSQFKPGNYLVADALGNLYVSDAGNNRIRKVNTSGQVTTLAGTGIPGFNDGNGLSAQFNFPAGIALDKQGGLYIADRGNFCIRKISAAGIVSTFAGSGMQGDKDGAANEAQFSLGMKDIIIDDQGNLYLSEGDRIRKVDPQGVVSTIAGSVLGYQDGDGPSARFNYPNGLSIDSQGKIYVADLNNNRIRKISYE